MIKLIKIARDFNKSIVQLAKDLKEAGINVAVKPNTQLTPQEYSSLRQYYLTQEHLFDKKSVNLQNASRGIMETKKIAKNNSIIHAIDEVDQAFNELTKSSSLKEFKESMNKRINNKKIKQYFNVRFKLLNIALLPGAVIPPKEKKRVVVLSNGKSINVKIQKEEEPLKKPPVVLQSMKLNTQKIFPREIVFENGYMMFNQAIFKSSRSSSIYNKYKDRITSFFYIFVSKYSNSFRFVPDVQLNELYKLLDNEKLNDYPGEGICPWDNIIFKDGTIILYSPIEDINKGSLFEPYIIHDKYVKEAFNYVKKFVEKKLPPIRVQYTHKKVVKVLTEIDLDKALYIIEEANNLGVDEINLLNRSITSNLSYKKRDFDFIVKKLSPFIIRGKLKEYRSRYIDFLCSVQDKNYKIIPAIEYRAFVSNMAEMEENSFIFTVKTIRRLFLVYENINEARSTILFEIDESLYWEASKYVFDFFISEVENKRELLANRDVQFNKEMIIGYSRLKHDNFNDWKFRLEQKTAIGYNY